MHSEIQLGVGAMTSWVASHHNTIVVGRKPPRNNSQQGDN